MSLPTTGSFLSRDPFVAAVPVPNSIQTSWKLWNHNASEAYRVRDYRRMADILEPKRAILARYSPHPLAVMSLLYLGSSELYRFRYQEALRDYLAGRAMARELGDRETAGILSYNISGLYDHTNAFDQAYQAADDALEALAPSRNHTVRASVLVHKARLTARLGRWTEARDLLRQAAVEARAAGDSMLEATVLEVEGKEYLKRGDVQDAEEDLQRALGLRQAARDPGISGNYQDLSRVKLAQGRPEEALRLINRALEETRKGVARLPLWSVYYNRAQAWLALHRRRAALEDLRRAISQIEAARLHMIQADAIRVNNEGGFQEVYTAFVETAADQYFATGDPALAAESLAAADTGRTLQWHESAPETAHPGDGYAEKLQQIQSAYAALYRDKTAQNLRELNQLRLELAEMEAEDGAASGAATPAPVGSIPAMLGKDDVLFVFRLGENASLLWSVDSDGIQLHRLPGRGEIEEESGRFVESIRTDADAAAQARSLYTWLFGSLSRADLRKPNWLLIPDGRLLELPFAALLTNGDAGRPEFLVEKHSLRLLPGLWALRRSSDPVWNGPALAVSDPVYNTADSRWRRRATFGPLRLGWLRRDPPPPQVELPRLPGSLQEVEACARLWRSESGETPTLLAGLDATPESLDRALATRPALIHLATHVVASPENAEDSLLALSLDAGGVPQLAGPEWISSRDLHPALVMLTGCRSGQGPAVRGEGLTGLTRAWLLAGAKAVAATHWPIPDDGQLAQSFYRRWTPGVNPPAEALQLAQIEMIRSASFRSRPRYWAAYFIVGRN